MKLNDLSPVLRSYTGNIQFCIVYDLTEDVDLENGCSVEYAITHYGDREVQRLGAVDDMIVITL